MSGSQRNHPSSHLTREQMSAYFASSLKARKFPDLTHYHFLCNKEGARHTQGQGTRSTVQACIPLSTNLVHMASTTVHDAERKETDPLTEVNGPHLDENKAEQIRKQQEHSSTPEENDKDSEKGEETGDDQDERDKHVIIIQPTRRIRTRYFIWGKTNAFRPRHNNRGICSNHENLLMGKGYNTRIPHRCVRVGLLVPPRRSTNPDPLHR